MLELREIKKDYVLKGQESVHALKGISLTFRKNEFVAILGPSGCGKTTLLNIIGGLDRYTSGDLIIKGVSTKNYKDGDWDTYRNHSIGFVFQSYNLIPHQTIRRNVELALTISGVSKAERRQRAIEALEKVGLKGQENKKPNQLSGGQMQRVAIARSLVNNPEILLADEPTGALDSTTSVQIMDLLKEVAQDRLVIMVTHNPDLANQYANRIVNLFDGQLTGDTNPFDGVEKKDAPKVASEVETNKGKKKRSSMSFFTAGGLSLANLVAKMKRTVLVTIAGSIGIIGISAVLAVSTGVNDYIDTMQDDMLSSYPLQISETTVDYTSLMMGLSDYDAKKIPEFDLTTSVGLDSMIDYLMDKYQDITSIKTNDINEDLLRYIEAAPEGYFSSYMYNYGIDVTNNIFTDFNRGKRVDNVVEPSKQISLNGLTQMYISELKTVENFGEYAMFVDLFTDFLKPLPSSSEYMDYIASQYDLVGSNSRMPSGDNEIVLVVDENQTLTDLLYAQMGFYSEGEFLDIAREALAIHDKNATQEAKNKKYEYPQSFTFDEILNKKLVYYPHDSIYSYRDITENVVKFEIQQNASDPTDILKFNLVYNPECDCLIGNISAKAGSISCILTRPSGTPSGTSEAGSWVWNTNLVEGGLNITLASGQVLMNVEYPEGSGNIIQAPVATYTNTSETTSGYMYEGFVQDSWTNKEDIKIVGILKKKPNINFGCLSRGAYYTQEFANKFINQNKGAKVIINDDSAKPEEAGIATYIKNNNAKEEEPFSTYVTYTYTSFIKGEDNPVYDVFGYANALNSDLSSSISSMISIRQASAYDSDKAHLRSLCGLASKMVHGDVAGSYTYEFSPLPQSISIYPLDFKAKDRMTDYLDKWNQKADIILPEKNGLPQKVLTIDDREELTYTDTVEMIINVINTLITAVTTALVAFTSLSLVVSCFMIAVITYISVVERTKEIGIIRSLGGRKKDVSRLFIAETFMTGLLSGVFGIVITYLFELFFNIGIYSSFKISGMANLTPITAVIMVAISIVLSVASGLIPSMKASHSDPVLALRSE